MKRLALAVALLVASVAAALAQSTASVIGPITPGDCPQFSSNTIIKDSGFNCNGTPAVAFGNPSASVGLTPVNGSALTAMRSDAAPPLSASVQSALTGLNNGMIFGTGAFGFSSTATPTVAGTIAYFNGTTWVLLAGNTTGIQTLTENASGVPSWSASGAGSVTSITPGAGLVSSTTAACSQTAITTSGTLSKAECVNPQTGTSYAIADGDRAKLITASNTSSQAYTIAQAGAASAFQAGWYADIQNINLGVVTITPTTSTINGQSSFALVQGATGRLVSDGANYRFLTSQSNSILQANPTTPTGPGGSTPVMMGLGVTTCRVTPTMTGRMEIAVQGYDLLAVASVATLQLRFGTGAGPANGAAFTGTQIGNTLTMNIAGAFPFRLQGNITGLALGTAIWIDIAASMASSTGVPSGLSCDAHEF